MEEVQLFQEAKSKMELAKRRQDAAILQQIVEPLAEAIEELSDSIKDAKNTEPLPEQNYFDKDLGKNVIEAIDKVFNVISKIKFPEQKAIDFAPLNTIATEIKKGNDNILELLNKPNQSEELYRLITAMVGKQNIFLEKGFEQINYSKELTAITDAINKKENMVSDITFIYGEGGQIKKAVPNYKK